MMNVRSKVALGHVGKMSGAVIRHEKSCASPRPTSMGAGAAAPHAEEDELYQTIASSGRQLDCVFNGCC